MLKKKLIKFTEIVLNAAERDPDFKQRLCDIFGVEKPEKKDSNQIQGLKSDGPNIGNRPKNRRAAALLDPVQVVQDGENALKEALTPLTLDQLRDIVADYGMDTKRLIMKWTKPERVIDKIIEVSVMRAQKGDAFREPGARSEIKEKIMDAKEIQKHLRDFRDELLTVVTRSFEDFEKNPDFGVYQDWQNRLSAFLSENSIMDDEITHHFDLSKAGVGYPMLESFKLNTRASLEGDLTRLIKKFS